MYYFVVQAFSGVYLKKYIRFFLLFLFFSYTALYNISLALNNGNTDEIKQQAYALYATQNYKEAYKLLDNLPVADKNAEIYLMLANMSEELGSDNDAIKNLNKSLDRDYTYYKAYYNLGCIFAKKNSYLLAANNFELAIKYNKSFASAYYNLACCQIKLKNYSTAKKNLIKAIELEPQNKDYYFNLAYCYKELNKTKQAKRLLDTYNSLNKA